MWLEQLQRPLNSNLVVPAKKSLHEQEQKLTKYHQRPFP
jgi:hypothetical protein